MGGEDGEVRGEHGGGDFAAVGAVADESAEETGGLGWEGELHGAAVAGCCCGGGGGPAVFGEAGEGDVGFGFIGCFGHGFEFLYVSCEMWGCCF